MSGAQIVFGIARRAPLSEYFRIVFIRNDSDRTCNTSTTAVEYSILRVQSADNFYNVTSRSPGYLFRTVSYPTIPRFKAWSLLARPVEAEIVSPYCRILINTSVGNPTVLLERFLRNRQVFRLRRRRPIPGAFIKEPRAVFLCQTSPQPSQPQVLAPSSLPIMSGPSSQG